MTAAVDSADTPDYELVSSFYGPGAIGCWLLVSSSIFIAWTLDPIRRLQDTIDNDLLAAMTFPAIAAGHTIHQVVHYPGGLLELARQGVFSAEHPSPIFIAMQVSENVNATSFCLSFSLLLIAIYHLRVRRALIAASLCLLVQFPRLLVADIGTLAVLLRDPENVVPWWVKAIKLAQSSPALLLYGFGLVAYVVVFAIVGSLLLSKSRTQPQEAGIDPTPQPGDGNKAETSSKEAIFGHNVLRGIIILFLVLPFFPGVSFHFTYSPGFKVQVSLAEKYKIPRIYLRSPVPPSGQALWTLDQTTALVGGIVTIMTTLYTTVKHRRDTTGAKKA